MNNIFDFTSSKNSYLSIFIYLHYIEKIIELNDQCAIYEDNFQLPKINKLLQTKYDQIFSELFNTISEMAVTSNL